MSGRYLLVIGTQCAALPSLSFLPQVARDLHDVLADPSIGGCDTTDLLIDPTVRELDTAIDTAVANASAAEATLVIALIGHGEYADQDFYVMARDSSCPPNSVRAYLLAQRIKEAVREHSMLDGLVLLLDTCHAGIAAAQAAEHWIRIVGAAGRRFEVLTASDDRTAANGCFSRSLVDVLRKGRPELGDRIHCADLKPLLATSCPNQAAQHLAFDGHRATAHSDDASWLARNPARTQLNADRVNADRVTAAIVADLLRWYEPTPALDELVQQLREPTQLIGVNGPAGSGKSTLLAAVSPGADQLMNAHHLVDAVAFPTAADSPDTVAACLGRQLAHIVPGFPCATTLPELVRALRTVAGRPISIALDASPATDTVVASMLAGLALRPVRLIVVVHLSWFGVALGAAESAQLDRYYRRRGVPEKDIEKLIDLAAGDWSVARALADVVVGT